MFNLWRAMIFGLVNLLLVSSCGCISSDIQIYNNNKIDLLVSLDREVYVRVSPGKMNNFSIPHLDVVSIYIKSENILLGKNIEYTYRFLPLKANYVKRCSYQLFLYQDKVYAMPSNENKLNYEKFLDDQPEGYPLEPM